MKWILTKNNLKHPSIVCGEIKTIAELEYKHASKGFRLNTGNRRFYFLERTGWFGRSVALKTEYGVQIANCLTLKKRKSGKIHINNNRVSFSVRGNQLALIRRDKSMAALCEIENINSLDDFEFHALLFTLVSVHYDRRGDNRPADLFIPFKKWTRE